MKIDDTIFEGGRKLPLVEEFYTIQGEGYHTGKAAYFIRLGGCDVGCRWCDAKATWNPSIYPPVPVDDIVAKAAATEARSIVITGGEPSLYPLDYLTRELKSRYLDIFIETSGANTLTGIFDWICLSPKRQKPPTDDIFPRANELKVIIQTPDDIAWAEENAAKVSDRCLLYLQPEWSRSAEMVPYIVEYVKQNPRWMISLQSHKFMRIP